MSTTPLKGKLEGTLQKRTELGRLFIIAALLALGINLLSSFLFSRFPEESNLPLLTGIGLVVVAVGYLVWSTFRSRTFATEHDGVLLFRAEDSRLVSIPGYSLSLVTARTLDAVLIENEALKRAWEDEPIRKAPEIRKEQAKAEDQEEADAKTSSTDENVSYIAITKVTAESVPGAGRPTKAAILLQEVLEFAMLKSLSTHLSGYYQEFDEQDRYITEFGRGNVPDLLLRNRVLAILSTPIEDRAIFVKSNMVKHPPQGEVHSIWGSDGSMYERFDLILPKGTTVSRPSPGLLVLTTSRFVLKIWIQYAGYSANTPSWFEEWFLGLEEDAIDPLTVRVGFEVKVRPLALLSFHRWKYFGWVDSFADRLEETSSFSAFLDRIGWSVAATSTRVSQRTLGRLIVSGFRSVAQLPTTAAENASDEVHRSAR